VTEVPISPSFRLWHSFYARWYDHREAGHRLRAAAWGWVADRTVRLIEATGWGV